MNNQSAPAANGDFAVQLLRPDARAPERKSAEAAGYDLFANEDATIYGREGKLIKTGIAIRTPIGHYGQIAGRSGLSVKFGVEAFRGVIDHDYQGEVMVYLYNRNNEPYVVKNGSSIAQLIILPYVALKPVIVDSIVESFGETERGANGFGSTDQKK